jgi:integrase/recombinase XerD
VIEPHINLSEPLASPEIESVSRPALVCKHCGGWRVVKRRKTPKGFQLYLCKVCNRHFDDEPPKPDFIVDPEAEYKKDVWDSRSLGLPSRVGRFLYKLSFQEISQPWMIHPSKQFIRFTLSTLSFSSASEKLLSIKRFSRFLAKAYPDIKPEDIDRSVIVDFLSHLASLDLSVSTRCQSIGSLRGFFEASIQNDWVRFRRYLVRHEDFPKRTKSVPRFIPQEVLTQLNAHLDDLSEPVMRMVMVIQECGMRISELLYLKHDCLIQDKSGDWFLRYYQFKIKKEITIPLSREIAFVIQEQQRYITKHLEGFEYLFCANEGGGRSANGVFIPTAKNMSPQAFALYLNKLATKHNICTSSGKVWHFQAHQFRHTVGTRMINNGVPQHIVQRYLGHESPNMTAVYAHIFDQTMKEEIAKFQGKVVNIAGQVIESDEPELDTDDLAWFKRNIQAQALPNGSCALPTISQGCPHANACLTCSHFRTTVEFLDEHKHQLEQTQKILEKAKANGWVRQVEMNEQVKISLENIVKTLEEPSDG